MHGFGPGTGRATEAPAVAGDLHAHLKSPQDPYVVVVLGSLRLSSGYCMPFHLAACCSRTVNSLIAG